MPIVTFSGSSDDIVCVEGCIGADEFECYNSNDDEIVHISFSLGGKLHVRAIYDGCWSFSAGLVSEDIPVTWPIRCEHDGRYSMNLIVDTGDEDVAVLGFKPTRRK